MDFLDPRRTRVHKIRLMVGYVLVAIAVALGTVILVYGAYGYGFDTKTGDIVQNGLLFVDSKPSGASIYLNSKSINHGTSDRLILPAGSYDLLLKKDGYRDWQRKFQLEEHTISRYVYPFLFPQKPLVTPLKSYSSTPPLLTESPDHHWLLVQVPQDSAKVFSFDEFDTTNLSKPPLILDLPADLITNANAPASALTEVEWSTDNTHLLLEHTWAGGSEFIVFDQSDPSKSFNVNKLFNTTPSEVAMYNKTVSQLYIYQEDGGILSLGDVGKATVGPPILRHILAFKPYQTSIIDYVTQNDVPTGEAQARIWNNNQSYPLYTFKAGNQYLVDTASYNGHTYFVAGSDGAGRVNLYKDPLGDIQNPSIGKAIPLLELEAPNALKVSFSDNARFVALEGGQNFSVYDFETQTRYQYILTAPLAGSLQWMDGHRLIGRSGDSVFAMDYDSSNQQLLVPTITSLGGFFSSDYNHLFTLAPVAGSSSVNLENVDMRAGVDLPKNPNQ